MLYFLRDYEGTQIVKAIEKHVQRSNAFPTPADIIAIINEKERLPEILPINCQEYWLRKGRSIGDRISIFGTIEGLIPVGRMKKYSELEESEKIYETGDKNENNNIH